MARKTDAKVSRMTLVDMDPIRWLALSAKMAVTVQETATIRDMISPRCCIAGTKIGNSSKNYYLCTDE
jgi:hypothetical protein